MTARNRTIKPEFFQHEDLWECEAKLVASRGEAYRGMVRLLFAGLWGHCDRNGRFRWRSRQLKVQILPFDNVSIDDVLDALEAGKFVRRYEVAGELYGLIPSFRRHQHVNGNERELGYPKPPTYEQGELFDGDPSDDWSGPGFACIGGEVWRATNSQVEKWSSAYPAVDVPLQLRQASAWLDANPTNKKTHKGMSRFLVKWLSRCQDRGGVGLDGHAGKPPRSSTSYKPMTLEGGE